MGSTKKPPRGNFSDPKKFGFWNIALMMLLTKLLACLKFLSLFAISFSSIQFADLYARHTASPASLGRLASRCKKRKRSFKMKVKRQFPCPITLQLCLFFIFTFLPATFHCIHNGSPKRSKCRTSPRQRLWREIASTLPVWNCVAHELCGF